MADAELRRRDPGTELPPLRSAEPEAAPDLLPAVTDADTAAEHAAAAADRRAAVDERRGLLVPAEDPDLEDDGEAWPTWQRPDRDAVLQPPPPELRAAPKVLEHAQAEAEA